MEFFANQSELAFSVAISKNPSTMKIEIHEITRHFSLQQAKSESDESEFSQKFEVGIRISVDRNRLYAIESLS